EIAVAPPDDHQRPNSLGTSAYSQRSSPVSISLPTASEHGIRQIRVGTLSRRMVQVPQVPILQLNPTSTCSFSRRTISSGFSGSASTVRYLPFTLSVILAIGVRAPK